MTDKYRKALEMIKTEAMSVEAMKAPARALGSILFIVNDALTEPVNLVTGCHQGHTPSLIKAADEMLNEPVINDARLAEAVDRVKAHIIGRKVTGMQKELTAALESLINHAVKGEKVAELTRQQAANILNDAWKEHMSTDCNIRKSLADHIIDKIGKFENGLKIIDGGTS